MEGTRREGCHAENLFVQVVELNHPDPSVRQTTVIRDESGAAVQGSRGKLDRMRWTRAVHRPDLCGGAQHIPIDVDHS